jgi:P27 family predicted phage terminase small subunit
MASRAGRPPKPKAAKILAGTFRKDKEPSPAEEFAPEQGIPECPAWLGQVAQEEWAILAADPALHRVMAKVDRIALAAWADALSTWRAAAAIIESEGLTMSFSREDGSTYLQQRPEVSIAHQARKQVVDFAREFGLTPSSRRKVAGPPSRKPTGDSWDSF